MSHRTRAAVAVQANSFAVPDRTFELKRVTFNIVNSLRLNFQFYQVLIENRRLVLVFRIVILRNAQLSNLVKRSESSRLNWNKHFYTVSIIIIVQKASRSLVPLNGVV